MEGVVEVVALVSAALTLSVFAKLGELMKSLEEMKQMLAGTGRGDGLSDAGCKPKAEKAASVSEPAGLPPSSSAAPLAPPPVSPPVVDSGRMMPKRESSARDRFWSTLDDWFCVRGKFAPPGMTREFAVATRWLLRIGSLLLVGAMAYFITLAINRGWIGPVQRVYGIMGWGVIGTVGGTWLNVKSERYSMLGEVFAALGLVAVYLAFGLGHAYFNPPVIGSVWAAFAGLVVATVAAGVLSVRLKSLTIAVLGLVGGFLVPAICSFSHDYYELIVYLTMLTVGASVVAWRRQWTALGFVAVAVAFFLLSVAVEWMTGLMATVGMIYCLVEYALVLALTIAGSKRRPIAVNGCCWVLAAVAGIVLTVASAKCLVSVSDWGAGWLKWHLLSVAMAHAALAWRSRQRGWGGTPVLVVLAFLAAMSCLRDCCGCWRLWDDFGMLVFCAFAAMLAELAVRTKERTLAVLSLMLTVACLIGWMVVVVDRFECLSDYWAGLANRSLTLWCPPLLFVFLGWRLAARGEWLEKSRSLLFVGAAIQAFVLVTAESRWFGGLVVPSVGSGLITIVWATIAAISLTAGIVRRWKAIRLTGLGLLGLSVFKVLFIDTASLATLARVAVFAAVGVLMVAGAFLYLMFKNMFEEGDK